MQHSLVSGHDMKEVLSTISSKGQVTIPAEVRRHLGVGTRDKLVFVLEPNGEVQLKAARYPTVASLRGAAGTLKQPRSWDELRTIAREDALGAKFKPQE